MLDAGLHHACGIMFLLRVRARAARQSRHMPAAAVDTWQIFHNNFAAGYVSEQ